MAALQLPNELELLVARERARLAQPGSGFNGEQRVQIAGSARSIADPGSASAIEPVVQAAAHKIYHHPASITERWLGELIADGLQLTQYVEILGIVSRLRALETLFFGLGHLARPLPQPQPGEPNRLLVDAKLHGAWVPTVGPASPPTVLSSLPAENAAMHDVHEVLYLAATGDSSGNAMGNMSVVRDGLNRTQMEFVAARTSLLNDCFF